MVEKKNKLIRKIKYNYEHMGIKNRTLLLISTLIIVTLALFIYIFVSVYNRKVSNDNIFYSEEILDNTITNLNSYFDEISSIANDTNYEYYLQNYLIEERENDTSYTSLSSASSMRDYEMSAKLFNSTMNNRSDVSSIMIFGKNSLLLYKSIYSYMYVITDYTTLPWYQNALRNPKQSIVTGPQQHNFLRGNTEQTISLSRAITSYEDGSFLGIILIDLNLNQISQICNTTNSETKRNLCIINSKGELVYQQNQTENDSYSLGDKENLNKVNYSMKRFPERNFSVTLGGEKYQVVYSNMGKTGWKVLSLTPYSLMTEALYQLILFILIVVIILFLLIIAALNSILSKAVKPIIVLKEHMDLADEGNLHIRAEIMRKDETGMLAKSFNNMLGRIENLMEQVVTEQEDKRKFELQALQAQINPHFLYNTLDSIIWMAEANNPNIVPMTEALAKLFRISLNKGNEFIKLEDELEHVRNYLVIQSMRYLNKFDYEIILEDDIRYCKTIKLIVQPIVENCIYHGIKKKKEKGMIKIRASLMYPNVVITVSDNGNGMNMELCEEILVKDATFGNTSGSGIGVKNVNERIQLYFGKEYGVSYHSVLGEGTVATILLPIIEDVIS
jgi:Predicted signal transduction protein with a C-terminal ATPase domain